MENGEVLVILMRLVKAYQKQAQEQALATVKWQNRLGAIEGELLKLIGDDKVETNNDSW